MVTVATIEEAAKRLQLSTKTVQRYLQSGKLVGHKINGRWKIRLPDDIGELESQQVNGSSAAKTDLEMVQAERDWLRLRVEELMATNRELTLANRELICALQSIGTKTVSEARRNKLRIVSSTGDQKRGEVFHDGSQQAAQSQYGLRQDPVKEAANQENGVASERMEAQSAIDQTSSTDTKTPEGGGKIWQEKSA